MSISLFRSLAGQYREMREINTTSMMNTISHHIEDQVINHKLPVDFFAGFQRFSLFPDQLERYTKLGQVCRRVYIFGVPDVRPHLISGVEYITLDPNSPLAKEWFVVVDTPVFWSVLSTMEVEGNDPITGRRRFDGLWSFDSAVVDRASLILSQALNTYYQPNQNRDYNSQNRHITEISNRMIGSLERGRVKLSRQRAYVQSMYHISARLADHADISNLMRETAKILHNALSVSGVVISLLDQSNRLVVLAAEGESNAKELTLHSGLGITKQAMDTGQIIRISDIMQTGMGDPYLPSSRSVMAVPIVGQGRIHGVISVGARTEGSLKEDDEQALSAVVKMLALPLDIPAVNGQTPALDSGLDNEKLKAPLAYLLTMNRKLRAAGGMSPQHIELLNQIEKLSIGIAQTVGVPNETIRRIIAQ